MTNSHLRARFGGVRAFEGLIALVAASGLAALAVTSPRLGFMMMAGAGVVVWCLRQGLFRSLLAGALVSFATASFSDQSHSGPFLYGRFLFAGALVVLAWSQPATRKFDDCTRQARHLVTTAWLLSLAALASAVWSVSPSTTIQQAIALALAVALIHGCVRRRWTTYELISGDLSIIFQVLTATFAVGIVGQYIDVGLSVTTSYTHRFYGLYTNPNTLGILAALSVPLGIGLGLHTRRIGYLLGSTIAGYSVLICESRTALLGLLVAAAFVIVRRGTSALLTGIGVVVGTIATVGLLGALPGPLQTIVDRFNETQSGGEFTNRGEAWSKALQLWEHRPYFGYGYRTGEIVFADNPINAFAHNVAHNSYLQILLELGLLGVSLAAVLVVTLVAAACYTPLDWLGAGMVGVVITGLCTGLTESALWGSGAAFFWAFWLVAAATCCMVNGSDAHGLRTMGLSRSSVAAL